VQLPLQAEKATLYNAIGESRGLYTMSTSTSALPPTTTLDLKKGAPIYVLLEGVHPALATPEAK
jgi:hypothetical protein